MENGSLKQSLKHGHTWDNFGMNWPSFSFMSEHLLWYCTRVTEETEQEVDWSEMTFENLPKFAQQCEKKAMLI